MKTINATVIDSGVINSRLGREQQLLVFALGKTNSAGKLRGCIYVGCVCENGETHFAESLQQIAHMNIKIAETLKFMREHTIRSNWHDSMERGRIIDELTEMQDLMVRLAINDDCHIAVPDFPKDDDQPATSHIPPIPAPSKKVPTVIPTYRITEPPPSYQDVMKKPYYGNDMEDYYEREVQIPAPKPAASVAPFSRTRVFPPALFGASRETLDVYYAKHKN